MKRLVLGHPLLIINIIVSVSILLLPYLLFNGKYYISGDDMRLYYIYPWEYLVEFTFSSWHHFSSVGAYGPTQFMIPMLTLFALLSQIIQSRIVVGYLGFSLPIILGYLFMQLLLLRITSTRYKVDVVVGSLMFITSPILISNQYFIFLSTIWLVPLVPLVSYLFIKYISSGDLIHLAVLVVASTLMSLGLFSIPWLMGFLLPVTFGALFICSIFTTKKVYTYLLRACIFLTVIVLSQLFWLLPFIMTYLGSSEVNFGSKVLSKSVMDTFSPTVLATATGNVVYPILNLFHRQIAFDFNWQLKEVFVSFFDKYLLLYLVFPFTIFLGVIGYEKTNNRRLKIEYVFFALVFIFALFLFTVNIGPLKNIFLILGHLPGFVMFRNFYDKLGLAYIFVYSTLICLSLAIVREWSKKLHHALVLFLISVIFFNFTRVGQIVNAPLWQTLDIGRNIMIPNEYLDFMHSIRTNISTTNNIMTIPFGTALYSVIKDVNSDNVYTGTSPVKLFSGVNDFSGFLSFYFSDANGIIENLIIKKQYTELRNLLKTYNINYLFVNNNIPVKVLNSWIFDKRMTRAQNEEFFREIAEKKPVIKSKNGSYQLFNVQDKNLLIKSNNSSFQKINENYFRVVIKGVKKDQVMYFYDSFHNGWQIYPETLPQPDWCRVVENIDNSNECESKLRLFDLSELGLYFNRPAFLDTHKPYSKYFVNQWTIKYSDIKKSFPQGTYRENNDGSLDISFRLYFKPQLYFYAGSTISLFMLGLSSMYIIYWVIRK